MFSAAHSNSHSSVTASSLSVVVIVDHGWQSRVTHKNGMVDLKRILRALESRDVSHRLSVLRRLLFFVLCLARACDASWMCLTRPLLRRWEGDESRHKASEVMLDFELSV